MKNKTLLNMPPANAVRLWLRTLDRIADWAEDVRQEIDWPKHPVFNLLIEKAGADLNRSLPVFKDPAPIFENWSKGVAGPSLIALAVAGVTDLRIPLSPKNAGPLLTAALLGEVPNASPYHNSLHYRKVLLQMLRMIAAHNEIYEDTPRALGPRQTVSLMVAACIHDLDHDGQGNTVGGVHEPGRLERRSFELAASYLRASGLDDSTELEALKIMLLCTDVSPLNSRSNPIHQAKAAYRFHFLDGQGADPGALKLNPELERLRSDSMLAQMCLVLHEADIATSAGVSYEITKEETILFRRELGRNDACPEHVLDFLNLVCHRQFLTDAGQKLYGAAMARIYALAEADFKAGNLRFEDSA
ncbi:MAG: 3',5'-cyclic nucleotide phosphodiesterase [Alphaproteobacteria bacterium]|nr:3',5'-cyclic nucleotide phosphodiesterase [Alphaproteobacteria bacterium]